MTMSMNKLSTTTFRISLALLSAVVLLSGTPTFATSIQQGVSAARGDSQPADLFGAEGIINNITNTLLFVTGALAVVMLIIGGIRYAVSGGNSASVTAAKNTILYALVGLIIAFLAFAIVNFVLGSLTTGGQAGFTNV